MSWQKLKFELDHHFGFDVCAVAIMSQQQNVESDWADALNKVQQVTDSMYTPKLQPLLNVVSEYASELVRAQFELSRSNHYTYHHAIAGYVFIRYDHRATSEDLDDDDDERDILRDYLVSTRKWTCSCMFRCTRLLPCRHVLYISRNEGHDPVVPFNQLHDRWQLELLRP